MQNTPTGAAHAAPQRNQRIVALDGLRALAIAGVILYHLRPSRLTGGFLGVTLFFTLSGYLATKSIMRATARDGFSYPRYIARRTTRLMPPILVTIALTAVATYIAAPSLLPKVQQDALPSALFLSNWFYIFRNVSYFAAAGLPSPLTHLWFCGVQMQFYLVWPLILMVLCSKTRSRNTAIGVTITFILISTAAMALMFDPMADTSRVYYGTDARAAELLCGALAAIAAPRLREMLSGDARTPGASKGISKVNVVSVAWLAAVVVGAFTLTGENPPALPRWLFAARPAHRAHYHLRAKHGMYRASSVVGQAARLAGPALILGLSGALSPIASYEPRNPHYPHRLVGAGITACIDPCGSRGFLSPSRTPLVQQAGPTGQRGKKARPRARHGAPRAWRRMRRCTCLRAT